MEIYYSVLMVFGFSFLLLAVFCSKNLAVCILILSGVILILISGNMYNKADRGKSAPSLSMLVTGEKYEVVSIYEKYIIIKSATDDLLRFIGPLKIGTETIGKYVKTAEESLVKIE